MIQRFLLFFILFCSLKSFSQENIPIGTWRFHPSTAKATSNAIHNDVLYTSVRNGITRINLTTNTTEFYSSSNFLNSLEPTYLNINAIGQVVIGYEDGNIDLIKNGTVSNILSLKNFGDATVEDKKRINHISFKGNDTAFFSTEIGLFAYNVDQEIIIYDYLFNDGSPSVEVLQSAYRENGDSIYIITSNRLFWSSGSLQFFQNPRDLENWDSVSVPTTAGTFTSLAIYHDTIYVGTSVDGVFYLDQGSLMPVTGLDTGNTQNLVVVNDTLYGLVNNEVIQTATANGQGLDTILKSNGVFTNLSDLAIASNGNYWLSSNSPQPIISNQSGSFSSEQSSNGPSNEDYRSLQFIDNKIVTLPSGSNANAEFSTFEKGAWSSENPIASTLPDSLGDITKIVKAGGKYYFGTNGSGLYSSTSLTGGTYTAEIFSSVTSTSNIKDLAVDGSGTLWILQNSSTTLCRIETSGAQSCPTSISNTSSKVVIDGSGNFWFLRSDGDLEVRNSNLGALKTFQDIIVDDVTTESEVQDLVLDFEGQLWFASSDGVGFVSDPNSAFNGSSSGTLNSVIRPIIGGFPALNDATANFIIVDGGNRKWVVTREDGTVLKLLRDDGRAILQEFDLNNSPLPTNQINAIRLDDATGELFVATEEGLFSYRTDATVSSGTHDNVRIFPNPVPPGFGGTIGISGLAPNVVVKITDISGNLVFETDAEGGTATWNGIDYTGGRAKSGVYLVFSSTDDGSETFIGKFAVID